jgi:hypothetical protein
MLLVLLRYNKRAAIALSPFLISIFPATIYGRFHYLSDGVLGILTAVAVTYWHPVFSRALSGHNVRLTALEAREGGAS